MREGRNIKPLLKWPGGKRWLAPRLAPAIRGQLSRHYIEPFVGGAAMLLAVAPRWAKISDLNRDLLRFYRVLRRDPQRVLDGVWRLSNTKACYYRVREKRPRTDLSAAIRFLYLNRTAWGGLYRLNSRGDFNVPFGNLGRGICSKEALLSLAAGLGRCSIRCEDFEIAIDRSQAGDVVYADPPYTTKGEGNGFLRYNESIFSWADQERLARTARRAARRGVRVMVSMLRHAEVLDLYPGWWTLPLSRPSNIARDPAARGAVSEVVLFSHSPLRWLQQVELERPGP